MRTTALLILLSVAGAAFGKQAQITTVHYTNFLAGSYSYLPNGLTPPPGWPPDTTLPLPTRAYGALLTASFSFEDFPTSKSLVPTGYAFDLRGSNGLPSFAWGEKAPLKCPGIYCSITPTISNGTLTGVTFDFNYNSNMGFINTPLNVDFEISPANGAQFDAFWAVHSLGTCESLANPPAYTGPTIDPCTISASTRYGGDWRVSVRATPEIDPDDAFGALTLLLGALVVMRGRRISDS